MAFNRSIAKPSQLGAQYAQNRDMDSANPETNVKDRHPSQGHGPGAASGPEAGARAREQALTALGNLEHGHRDAMEELRVALCAYVGILRRSGSSREETMATIRSLITSPATPAGALALTPVVREALAELTLQWCEAEYDRLAGEAG